MQMNPFVTLVLSRTWSGLLGGVLLEERCYSFNRHATNRYKAESTENLLVGGILEGRIRTYDFLRGKS